MQRNSKLFISEGEVYLNVIRLYYYYNNNKNVQSSNMNFLNHFANGNEIKTDKKLTLRKENLSIQIRGHKQVVL